MGAVTKTLYETEADVEHAAEEIEDLGRSERSAVASQLQRMLMHLIRQRIQPERDGASWRRSISEGRSEIEYRFDDSPSLRRYAEKELQKIYLRAARDALFETGFAAQRDVLDLLADCPYTLEDLLESDSPHV